jgi:WD40 repeat protein
MRRLVGSVLLATAIPLVPAATQAGGAEPNAGQNTKLEFQYTIKGYHGGSSGPCTSPNGKLRVRVEGLTLRLYDRRTGKQVGVFRHADCPRKGQMVISHWAFSPDGQLIALGVGDEKYKGTDDTAGDVEVWQVDTGKLVASSDKDIGRVTELAFVDNHTLRVYSYDISGK